MGARELLLAIWLTSSCKKEDGRRQLVGTGKRPTGGGKTHADISRSLSFSTRYGPHDSTIVRVGISSHCPLTTLANTDNSGEGMLANTDNSGEGMLFNTALRPCRRLAGPRRLDIGFVLYNRSIAKPLVTGSFVQSRHLASKIKRKASKNSDSYESKVASYASDAGKLAQRSAPTLLYEAQSNLPFILGCYFIGGGLIWAGWINNVNSLTSHADVPAYVPVFTAVGCFSMIAVGGWMCLRVCSIDTQ